MTTENALALLQINLPDGTERSEAITQTPFNLGRVPGNQLVIPESRVSRQHARLLVEGDRVILIDLNSTNGTIVGEARLPANQPYTLAYGEEFQIGSYTLRLEPVPVQAMQKEPEPTAEISPAAEAATPEEPPPEPEIGPDAEPAPEAAGLTPVAESVPTPPGAEEPRLEPEVEESREAPAEPEPTPQVQLGVTKAPPPPPTPPQPPLTTEVEGPSYDAIFGLALDRSRYLQYLPPIYDEHPFLGRFLVAFEGILAPVEQTVDNLDLYLDPGTAPAGFLDQLAGWLGMTLDEKWPEKKRRAVVNEAAELYRVRGTRRGLSRHLEIYTEVTPEIVEPEDQPHHFHVVLRPKAGQTVDRATVERIILANKPAHTTFSLEIKPERQN